MEVHIYSIKAKSQAGNIGIKDIMTAARDRKNLIFTIHNISVLLKINQIFLKTIFSNSFSRSTVELYFVKKKWLFLQQIMKKNARPKKKLSNNIIKDARNHFGLKKGRDDTTIKYIRKFFRL